MLAMTHSEPLPEGIPTAPFSIVFFPENYHQYVLDVETKKDPSVT